MQNPQKHQIIFHPNPSINTQGSIFFLGSCFSDVIAEKCIQNTSIRVLSNPYGTLFHPIALLENLKLLVCIKNNQNSPDLMQTVSTFLDQSIYQYNNQFHSLLHAYKFNNINRLNLIEEIVEIGLNTVQFLENASSVFITLGTAVYYHHTPTNTTVGNCHKLPQTQFNKQLSTTVEIQGQLSKIQDLVAELSPGKPLIFTISPVRHLRDGMQTSAISKSTLQIALYEHLGDEKYHNTSFYFPSYEFITEENAENTKYKFDGMHILEVHENSIFQKFIETYVAS